MALILSVDLAYRHYEDFGFCLLEESAGKAIAVQYLHHQEIGLEGTPQAETFAYRVLRFCLDTGVSILMLDGSQGWKDPVNGLLHYWWRVWLALPSRLTIRWLHCLRSASQISS